MAIATKLKGMLRKIHCHLSYYWLVDMDCNCTSTGFEVHACTASSPHVRKKYVTGPAKIDHESANYTELYFC